MGLADYLTTGGKHIAAMVSAEVGQAFGHDIAGAKQALLNAWQTAMHFWLPAKFPPPKWSDLPIGSRISQALSAWSRACSKPIVLLIDEVDALRNDALIAVLRQLHDGYTRRPKGFPASVGLIGPRDARDYKVASGSSDGLQTARPFDIKVESLTMRGFYAEEVAELYQVQASKDKNFEERMPIYTIQLYSRFKQLHVVWPSSVTLTSHGGLVSIV